MANIKVSEMTEATTFEDGDYTMIVQANQNKKISKENMLSAIPTIQNDISTINTNVGDLTQLETANKDNLVNSINNLCPTILYSDDEGASGDITLSDSVENYSYIEIFYSDQNDIFSSVKVYEPNGKIVSLLTQDITTGKIQFYTKNIEISGTSITNINFGYTIQFTGSNITGYNNSQTYIKIIRILGYK